MQANFEIESIIYLIECKWDLIPTFWEIDPVLFSVIAARIE